MYKKSLVFTKLSSPSLPKDPVARAHRTAAFWCACVSNWTFHLCWPLLWSFISYDVILVRDSLNIMYFNGWVTFGRKSGYGASSYCERMTHSSTNVIPLLDFQRWKKVMINEMEALEQNMVREIWFVSNLKKIYHSYLSIYYRSWRMIS